ncbi:MAG: ATP-dependent protease subunit HslV [bacterium]
MFKGTTIIAVRDSKSVVIAGDGQVSMGPSVIKSNANKLRRLGEGKLIAGFAGSTSDAITLFEIFEEKLKRFNWQTRKAAVELSKTWRKDKVLGQLEALLLVADEQETLLISGNGDVLSPENDVIAIGSGGNYAYAAALALQDNTRLGAEKIAVKSLEIASNICVYTNSSISTEKIKVRG